MGSLYIGGGQCKYAPFKSEDDTDAFDEKFNDMRELAMLTSGVFIDRYEMEELSDGYNFVISNQKIEHHCFFSGGAVAVDMSVEVSDTFDERACAFIKALEADPEFSEFHGLQWSESKVVYFAVS